MAINSAPQQQGIMFNQAAHVAGINDIDVTITDARFMAWDYNGATDAQGNPFPTVLALGVTFVDEAGEDHDEFYSCGEKALTQFTVSPDQHHLLPTGPASMVSDSCKFWHFIQSIQQCGFEMANDIGAIVGMKVHVLQIVPPKRPGLIRGGKDQGSERGELLVTAILELPGQATQTAQTAQAKKAPAKAPASAKPASKPPAAAKPNGAAPAPEADGAEHALATEALLSALKGAEGQSITKAKLAPAAFTAAGELVKAGQLEIKNKNAIVQLMTKDSFLHGLAQQGFITYADGVVALVQ